MHYAFIIMHCRAFFEPPPNHLRITSEQAMIQKWHKNGINTMHYAFIIMHYALNYAFIRLVQILHIG